MRLRMPLAAAILTGLVASHAAHAAGGSGPHHRIGLIGQDNVKVYSEPSTHSRALTVLVQQTQVEVLGNRPHWTHVTIWAGVQGWVQTREIVYRKPWTTVSTYRAPEVQYHVHARAPAGIHASAIATATEPLFKAPGGAAAGTLQAGSRITVTAWSQDNQGQIWYRIPQAWALGDGVRFLTSDPGRARAHGRLLWERVAGKGMWITLGTISQSASDAIVRAALHDGITHLYLESAISPLGFHGEHAVGPLLDAAHRAHIAVLAWVYPYLLDIASDVALTRQVTSFKTASGERFDGIAADLERNVHESTVRSYSQLIRAYLGSGYLLVGVTYPPQSFPDYPFAEIARQYNVIAPMDYWHQTKTKFGLDYGHMPYGYDYSYRYAVESVAAIQRAGGNVPISPIGQTFDDFGRLEMGPNAPSAPEIQGFLAGSRRSGSIGVSFFQWMTAAVEEWQAISTFHF